MIGILIVRAAHRFHARNGGVIDNKTTVNEAALEIYLVFFGLNPYDEFPPAEQLGTKTLIRP